jgi:hypothetical protein
MSSQVSKVHERLLIGDAEPNCYWAARSIANGNASATALAEG